LPGAAARLLFIRIRYNKSILGIVKRTVQKIGNSLMVSIPTDVARRLDIREGDRVEVNEEGDGVAIRPARSVAELLAGWEPLGPPGIGAEMARAVREDREARAEAGR
jgi:AbrB family looped-hinge helix DNA binding protein